MSVVAKIANAYQLFILCNRNINATLGFTKITRGTLQKYIKIQECLDFTILEYLDKKGKEKLGIGEALIFCDTVLNPDQQYEVFQLFIKTNKKDRIRVIKENNECMICMDSNALFEYTPCCKTPICEKCFTKTFESYIQDIIFKSVDCPFCKVSLNLHFVNWFLTKRLNNLQSELWRNTNTYKNNISHCSRYLENLRQKYTAMISKIEQKQDYYITDDIPDFKSLLGEDKYFGMCSSCTPTFVKGDHVIKSVRWVSSQICDIPKECGDGEGGLLILEPEMFRCVVCKSRDEDFDNGEFKKCPHCGIKTLKPDGCNYIYCGDHRWCFVCNERIENNADGHNKHYWTGPGTSPYSNQCRESINSLLSKFLIKSKCDCSECNNHGGAPLCRNLDCMNRTSMFSGGNYFNSLCNSCK